MNEGGAGPEFLNKRFPGLAKSPEVTKAAHRTERLTGESVPRDPDTRIQNYLNRFREIIERDDPQARARGITALKKVLVGRYVVRVEDIPESYWAAQIRVVRNRGESGDLQDLSDEEVLKRKQDHLAQDKEDQKGSIEEWIDYLSSERSSFLPDYLKYWVFVGMLRLERYEKAEKDQQGSIVKQGRFPERPTGKQRSVKMFPEVNENGLKFIASAYKQLTEGRSVYWGYNQDIPDTARQSFLDALAKKDFRALYGWTQEYLPPISEAEMQTIEGEWRVFSKSQGNTGKDVSTTLVGKGTGWCIAGSETAQGNYLDQKADLHIYYTRDSDGKFTIPRVVIVSSGNRVTEVRGIEWEENLDNYMKATDVIGSKLKELPGGEAFFETDTDTKQLTAIDKKMVTGTPLTNAELTFLWEIDRPIKYFGYKKDPRIEEIRSQRNPEEDMSIVFDCTPDQIARNPRDIRADTRAYVGPLEPGIFNQISKYGIEQVYTKFPEGKIHIEDLKIERKTKAGLKQKLDGNVIKWRSSDGSYAEGMIYNPKFPNEIKEQSLTLVTLRVSDLGFDKGMPTIDQIYGKGEELGLELCLPEVGPEYRISYKNQPMGEWRYIAMDQITDSLGNPRVFGLGRGGGGELWLNGRWVTPDDRWPLGHQLVFSLRRSEPQNSLKNV